MIKRALIFKENALDILISESGGSARDAINLLEQVRLLNGDITDKIVLKALGKISEKELFELFNLLIDKRPSDLIAFLSEISFERLSPQALWNMLVNLCRVLIWAHHGASKLPAPYNKNIDKIKKLSQKCSISRLNAIMQLFFTQEDIFLKTTQKHVFLETVLLQICSQINSVDLEQLIQSINETPPVTSSESVSHPTVAPKPENAWDKLQGALGNLGDNLLISIFTQAKFIHFENRKLGIMLANNSSFLSDKVRDSLEILKPVVRQCYPNFEEFDFIPAPKGVDPEPKKAVSHKKPLKVTVDVTDKEKWPKANLLVGHFSG